MELTNKQSEGLSIAVARYRAGEKYTVISGYAGTGKSTLVKFIIEALANEGIDPENDIAYCAFTGKAAQVLIDKGCPNAMTAHKLLYQARPLPNGSFLFIKKPVLEYSVIVVDECSMLPLEMTKLLLSHSESYVIFCGDPGQLPPIDKTQDNHLLDHPHIFLDEIMRQAQDSGIIQLSMKIRNGESIDGFKSDDAIVLPKSQLNTGMLEWADQILCATNATRKNLNSQCRQLRGYVNPIEENEKIISLRNNWECISENGAALTNGCIGTLTNFCETFIKYPSMFHVKNNILPIIHGKFITDTGEDFGELDIDKTCLITGEGYLDNRQKYIIGKNKKWQNTLPKDFTYGYAITTWKFQGSSASKILGIEEKFPFDKEEHKKFLYTMVTRAENKCVIIRSV